MRSAHAAFVCLWVIGSGCAPALIQGEAREPQRDVPASYAASPSAQSDARVIWRDFFGDPTLIALVDVALQNNQELNLAVQEILITNTEILARRGEVLPRLDFRAGAGIDKVGRHTSQGAADEANGVPEHLQNYTFGFYASWEVDIWRKLRNATDAAVYRYLASIEGRNFMITRLVAEIADLYYELMALDQQLTVVHSNVELLEDGLEIVRLQKEAARVTELAVTRFEAEVFKNKSRQFEIQQQIVETENRINFLVGRFPRHVTRDARGFLDLMPKSVQAGLPTQLLENRADIRQAELALSAAKMDIAAARAAFYPSLSFEAGLGYRSYDAVQILSTPASLLYNLAANLTAPLLNRNGLTAAYNAANARQIQAVIEYERAVLGAYVEVANQLALIDNVGHSYELKSQQVERLNTSIDISNQLFASARADYLEVLTTRRDALDATLDLIEIKQRQMTATVHLYQALGGGWQTTDAAHTRNANSTAANNAQAGVER